MAFENGKINEKFRKGPYILTQKKSRKWKTFGKKQKRRTTYKKRAGNKRKTKKGFVTKKLEIVTTVMLLAVAGVIFVFAVKNFSAFSWKQERNIKQRQAEEGYRVLPAQDGPCGRPEIIQDYIVKNPYSRSGLPLEKVNGVVVHYVGNAGSTAEENRDYFENLKDTHLTKASSHFIVGIDGEIVQCIPLTEISYASNDRNSDTISIECCHKKENGKFSSETYKSLVKLTAWLCSSYGITADNVIRHYDVTGKMCPKYFVKHEDAWKDFLSDIQKKLEKKG